jgi:hypothetical protein
MQSGSGDSARDEVNRLILALAEHGSDATDAGIKRIREHVARAGFDPDARECNSMAQRTELAERIDRTLRYSHAMLDEVCEIVHEWESLDENEWLNWMLDWDQFALSITRTNNQH